VDFPGKSSGHAKWTTMDSNEYLPFFFPVDKTTGFGRVIFNPGIPVFVPKEPNHHKIAHGCDGEKDSKNEQA